MERNDARRANHPETSWRHQAWRQAYFNVWRRVEIHGWNRTLHHSNAIDSLWEKLHDVYEKKSSSSKLILIRQIFNMKVRETDSSTSHINTFSRVLSELSSQGINFEEEVKALTLLSSHRQAGRYSAQLLPTVVWSWIWTKQSVKSSWRISRKKLLDSPSMNQQKPIIRPNRLIGSIVWENKPRERVEIPADQDIGKTDNDRSREIVDQVFSTLIAEKLVTMFLIASQSRGRRTVDESSGIRDYSTQTVLQKAIKSVLPTPNPEKSSH